MLTEDYQIHLEESQGEVVKLVCQKIWMQYRCLRKRLVANALDRWRLYKAEMDNMSHIEKIRKCTRMVNILVHLQKQQKQQVISHLRSAMRIATAQKPLITRSQLQGYRICDRVFSRYTQSKVFKAFSAWKDNTVAVLVAESHTDRVYISCRTLLQLVERRSQRCIVRWIARCCCRAILVSI